MGIIIISALFPPDQNPPEQVVQEETPAPVIPQPPKAGDPFFSGINKLTQDYQGASDPQKKNDLIEEIYNYPMGNGTVGSWLAHTYTKYHPQSRDEAEQQARILIWNGIDQEYRNNPENLSNRGRELKPVENIIGWLDDQMKLWGKRDMTKSKTGPESDRFTEYQAYLKPLMIGVRDHTDKIAPDLLEKVDNGQMKPEQAAWSQFKRNTWNDQLDPQTGKTRIETAKAVFQQRVDGLYAGQIEEVKAKLQPLIERAKTDPKVKKNFDKMLKDVMRTVPRFIEIKSMDPLQVGTRVESETEFNQFRKMLGAPEFNDPKNPLYLTGTMFTERASADMLSQMWSALNSGPNQSVDTQDQDVGEGRGYEPSTEDGHLLPKMQDAGPLTQERKKTIIEDAPETFLSEFNDDPEIMQGIEKNLHLIQPYVPVRDKAGNIVMDRARPQTMKNPKFRQNIESITQSLYGHGSMPRSITDERGRPRPIPKPTDDRTKEALFLIGQFYANSIDDNRDEHTRLKELERNLAPYVQQPLALQHYEGPPLKGSQQYALALREVMLDMMKHIGTDHNIEAAQFRSWIRTATFLYINKIIGA